MAKPVALTAKQVQEGAAADLVALLQSVTSDGRVTTEEIKELYNWLKINANLAFPGMELLKQTIEAICSDGRVTDQERIELLKVIERVLPPEFREIAKERRKIESIASRERAKLLKQVELEAREAEAARFRPEFDFDFVVAGVAYEKRYLVTEMMKENETVYLIRDRANAHSANAIEVRTAEGFHIGFVPERDAAALAEYLDHGYRHIAWVKRLWHGRQFPTPIVIAEIYKPDTERAEAVREDQVPRKQPILARDEGGSMRLLLVILGGLVLLAIVLAFLAT
jgi:hypothetical protein